MDDTISRYEYAQFDELNWCYNEGIMYQRDMTESVPYDADYFEKYVTYENTQIAIKLNNGRTRISSKYCNSLLDIGIGSGEFIESSNIKVLGFDINKVAIEWLKSMNLFVNPYEQMPDVDGLTFWDSLEHIPNPGELLSKFRTGQYAIISIPVFDDLLKVKHSKHYKPNEHYYYYTPKGLIKYMKDMGFNIIEISDYEVKSGREDILTFVFIKN